MRRAGKHLIVLSFLILFNVPTVLSGPLFHDDFSDPYFTAISWILNDPNNGVMTFSENGISLKNSHLYNSIILRHSLSKKYQSFSISTHILSESAGCGIFFNVTTQAGKINGYAALISYEKVELLKFSSGTHSTLASHSSPFIKSSDNVLTVSRKDSLILLFCNGFFLYSYCDSELPPGDCAIMIQPRTTTVFSNFEFRSTPLDSVSFRPFSDNFSKPHFFGWRKSGSGFSSIVDSSLEMTANTNERLHYTIDQPMQSFKLVTDFLPKKINDTDSSACGIVIMAYDTINSDSSICIRVGCNSDQLYSVEGLPEGTILKKVLKTEDSAWKQLRLIYDNSLLRFYCDNNLCFEADIPLRIKSAGLFSSKGSVVRFDNFTLERLEDAVTVRNVSKYVTPAHSSLLPDNTTRVVWTDLMGRSISTLDTKRSHRCPVLIVHNRGKRLSDNLTQ
jgi:hypothetical protein